MNPEFEKNLWREITPNRLLVMPFALAILAVLGYQMDDSVRAEGSTVFAFICYASLVFFHGSRLAYETVVDEARQGTWDNLRLSALSPWELTWGKLLGGTSHAWYGGLLALVWFGVASAFTAEPGALVRYLLIMVAGGVASHALAMMAALLFLDHIRTFHLPFPASHRGGHGVSILVLVILLAVPSVLENEAITISWWLWKVPGADFALASVWVFLFWFLLGVRQLFAAALNLRPDPWPWLGFTLFLMLYVAGLPWFAGADPGSGGERVGQALFVMALTGIFLSYLMAFLEPLSPSVFLNLFHQYRTGHGAALFAETPRAFLTLGAAAAVLAPMLFLSRAQLPLAGNGWIFLLSVLLFAVRDLAVFAALQQGRRPERARSATLMYLVFFYGVLPMLFGVMDLPGINHLFLPGWDQIGPMVHGLPEGSMNLSLLFGSAEAMLAVVYLSVRLKRVLGASLGGRP